MSDSRLVQAVILAGGRGTRLGSLTREIPKPLIPINGRPFLSYLLKQLKTQGIEQVLLLTGYLGDRIQEYCGDGSRWGIKVIYGESDVDFETTLRLKNAYDKLNQNFLLMYCDNYWPMNLDGMWNQFINLDKRSMVTVYSNLDDYSTNNIKVGNQSVIESYDSTRSSEGLNGVEIGYSIIRRDHLDFLCSANIPFAHNLFPRLIEKGLLGAYKTDHRYYSIGSRERLPVTSAFLEPQLAVILDRDGTLNERPPVGEYVKTWGEFKWLPGSIDAMRLLKQSGYKLILASNQSGIGRGIMTESDLASIHKHMEQDLLKHGVQLDAIYYCPHDWDADCICRKPKPGMLFRAQREFHLDLTKTYFIGDDPRDELTGIAANSLTALVNNERSLLEVVTDLLINREDIDNT